MNWKCSYMYLLKILKVLFYLMGVEKNAEIFVQYKYKIHNKALIQVKIRFS